MSTSFLKPMSRVILCSSSAARPWRAGVRRATWARCGSVLCKSYSMRGGQEKGDWRKAAHPGKSEAEYHQRRPDVLPFPHASLLEVLGVGNLGFCEPKASVHAGVLLGGLSRPHGPPG